MSDQTFSKNESLANKNSSVEVSRSKKQFFRPKISGATERFLELYHEYLSRFSVSDSSNILFSPEDVSLTPEEFKAKYNSTIKPQIQAEVNPDPILEIIYNNKELMTECGVTFEEMYNIASSKGGAKILESIKVNKELMTECGVTFEEMYNIASSRGGEKILNIIGDNKDLITKCKVPFEQIFKIASEDKGAEILGAISKNIELITEKPHVSFGAMLEVTREIDGPNKLGILNENKALIIECGVSFQEMSDVLKEGKGEEILATINSNRELISKCGMSFEAMKKVAKEGGAEILEFMNNNRAKLGVNRVSFDNMVHILKEEIKGQTGSSITSHNKDLIKKVQNVLRQSKLGEVLNEIKQKPSPQKINLQPNQEKLSNGGEKILGIINKNSELVTKYEVSHELMYKIASEDKGEEILGEISKNIKLIPHVPFDKMLEVAREFDGPKKLGILNENKALTIECGVSFQEMRNVLKEDKGEEILATINSNRKLISECGVSFDAMKKVAKEGGAEILKLISNNGTRLEVNGGNFEDMVHILNDEIKGQTGSSITSHNKDLIKKVQNVLRQSKFGEVLNEIKQKPFSQEVGETLQSLNHNKDLMAEYGNSLGKINLGLPEKSDGSKKPVILNSNKALNSKSKVLLDGVEDVTRLDNVSGVLESTRPNRTRRIGFNRANLKGEVDINDNVRYQAESYNEDLVAKVQNFLGETLLGKKESRTELSQSLEKLENGRKNLRLYLEQLRGGRKILDTISANKELMTKCKVPFELMYKIASENNGAAILGAISKNIKLMTESKVPFDQILEVARENDGPKKLGILHRNRELMTECHLEFKQMRDILKEDRGERTLDTLTENRKFISLSNVPFEKVKEVAKLDEGREILGIISQNRIRLGVNEGNFGDLAEGLKKDKQNHLIKLSPSLERVKDLRPLLERETEKRIGHNQHKTTPNRLNLPPNKMQRS